MKPEQEIDRQAVLSTTRVAVDLNAVRAHQAETAGDHYMAEWHRDAAALWLTIQRGITAGAPNSANGS